MSTTVNQNYAGAFERMQQAVRDKADGQRVVDNMYVFEDRTNVLAMSYPSLINLEGNTFYSGDHLLTYLKALCFNDHASAKKIATCGSQKEAARVEIKGFKPWIWKKFERKSVETVCSIRARQSPAVQSILKGTGSKMIVFASKSDTYFGCGLGINDNNVLFPQFWTGQNMLGKIYEHLRKSV